MYSPESSQRLLSHVALGDDRPIFEDLDALEDRFNSFHAEALQAEAKKATQTKLASLAEAYMGSKAIWGKSLPNHFHLIKEGKEAFMHDCMRRTYTAIICNRSYVRDLISLVRELKL